MNKKKPTYNQLEIELADSHQMIESIRSGHADAVLSKDTVKVLRLKEVENALRESEKRLRTVLDVLPVGVFISDEEGKLFATNSSASQIWGGKTPLLDTPDQYDQYKGWWTETGKQLKSQDWAMFRAVKEGQASGPDEIEIECYDGTRKIILNYAAPVKNEQGDILGGVAVNVDITSRKQIEQELKKAQEFSAWLARIPEESPEPFIRVSAEGKVLYCNPAARMKIPALETENYILPDPLPHLIAKAMQQTEITTHEVNLADRIYSIKITPFPSERYANIYCHDITESKKAEKELQKSRKELEDRVNERTAQLKQRAGQLARLASELTRAEQRERKRLAKMLHDDLQQLIAAAKMHIGLIDSQNFSKQNRQMISQALELLDESIQTSRSLATDLAPPVLQETGLLNSLEWLCRWVKQKHYLDVVLKADEETDIETEEIKLLVFESVRELLFNTVKHSGVKKAEIEVTRIDDKIKAVVSDKGSGFDPSDMNSGSEQMQAGFGLMSMRERIKLIGGNLEIQSAPGKGSTFSIILPLLFEKRIEEKIHKKNMQRKLPVKDIVSERKQKIRILLVDDHTVVRQGISALLKREKDIEIIGQAKNGQEAIRKAHQLQPDVILMDCSMPKMSGPESTRIIHASQPDIRIIGLSMYDEDELGDAMKQAGASAFLSKTGPADKLLAEIRATASNF